MKALVKIFAEFERNKPLSQVFIKEKDFDNEDGIVCFCEKVMKELQVIYESKIFMKVEIIVEPILFDNSTELLPE